MNKPNFRLWIGYWHTTIYSNDIEVKELEVRKEITIAASDDFNFETPSEALIVLIQNETNTIIKSTTNKQRISETGSIKELIDSVLQ